MADLKSMLLGSRNFRIKRIEVPVWNEEDRAFATRVLGIRQVTLLQRAEIGTESSRASTADEKARHHAKVVMYAACDPDTGERLFEPANLSELSKQPAGGWVDQVAAAALEVMSLPVTESFCQEPAIDRDGKPVLEDGKPAKCGGKLDPRERYCPRCGREAPSALEQVQRS